MELQFDYFNYKIPPFLLTVATKFRNFFVNYFFRIFVIYLKFPLSSNLGPTLNNAQLDQTLRYMFTHHPPQIILTPASHSTRPEAERAVKKIKTFIKAFIKGTRISVLKFIFTANNQQLLLSSAGNIVTVHVPATNETRV